MRILYWTSHFWPDVGGIEVLALETLPALQKRGYEITVVAGMGDSPMPDFCVQEGIPVHRFDFRSAFTARDLRDQMAIQQRVAALKKSFAPDLVHLNYVGNSPYFHLKTRKSHPAPLLVVIHSDFSNARGDASTLFGQCLRDASWICGVSRATLDDTLQFVPDQAARSSVIFNGLKTSTLTPTPLPFEPPHILCLGRLEHDKGFDIALDAFALLLKEFPTTRLTIVGEGAARPALEARAASLRLGAQVNFTGRLERAAIAPMINRATMVVVPSRYREPFALVVLEAAQMGRPVVATRWGGLMESVADGKSGLLVENENVTAFADAMKFLLKNRDVAREMGDFGRARVRDHFSLENCVNQYDALYQKIARESVTSL